MSVQVALTRATARYREGERLLARGRRAEAAAPLRDSARALIEATLLQHGESPGGDIDEAALDRFSRLAAREGLASDADSGALRRAALLGAGDGPRDEGLEGAAWQLRNALDRLLPRLGRRVPAPAELPRPRRRTARRSLAAIVAMAGAWAALLAANAVLQPTAAFPSQAAIYWRDANEAFGEDRAVYFPLPAGGRETQCEVPLPDGARAAALRFDPSRRAGTGVRVSGIAAQADAGALHWSASLRDWTLAGGDDAGGGGSARAIRSTGADMYLSSPPFEPREIAGVRIRYAMTQYLSTREWLAMLLSGGNLAPQPPPPPRMVEPQCREVLP